MSVKFASHLRSLYLLIRQIIAAKLIDPLLYHFNLVFVRSRDLRRFTHIVASREGLYAVNQESYTKICNGQFFGLTVDGSSIFCFQATDFLWAHSRRGRIIEFKLEDRIVRSAKVRAKRLDNGCHQIDFMNNDLYVVDTYNQCVLKLNRDFEVEETHYPIGTAPRDAWDQGYAHLNSIYLYKDEIYLLASHGGMKTGKRSELLRCNRSFEVLETQTLPGLMCHNLVFLEDGSLISCGSSEGTIITRDRVVAEVGEMMTRGLSVDDQILVVGDSFFSVRHQRRYAPGNIFFYDRSYQLLAKQTLPAAPTEIRRIDGRDLSLSDFRSQFTEWTHP